MGLDGNGVVDGVGGAAFGATEEGVEVEGLIVGMGEGGGIWVGVEPFVGEDGGDDAGRAKDGGGETAGAEGGAVDEEVELVGGVAAIVAAVEGDGEDAIGDAGGGDGYLGHRTLADYDAGIVDVAVGGEAVFVNLAEEGVGAVVLADRKPVEADEVGVLHVGRELGDYSKVAAVRLLRLGLGIGYVGWHGALALASVPGVVYLVAEFSALGVAVLSCHNELPCCIGITYVSELYCVEGV